MDGAGLGPDQDPMGHRVERQARRAGDRPAGDELPRPEVVGAQLVPAGHVEPVAGPAPRHRRVFPARFDEDVGDGCPEVRLSGHPVVAEGDQAEGHRVLGEMGVGELVDVVDLPVAPVLEELGRGPGVVDLVEVHPIGFGEPEPADHQRCDDDHDEEPQVEPIEPPTGLPVEPTGSVRQDRTNAPEPERERQAAGCIAPGTIRVAGARLPGRHLRSARRADGPS